MTKLVFYITMPALILITVSKTPMTGERWLLPLANFAVNLACFCIALMFIRWRKITGITAGSMVIGPSLINTIFMLPFVLAFFGETGLANALLFDFGNTLFMATIAYAAAHRFSGQQTSNFAMLGKVLSSPIVISLVAAILISITSATLPRMALEVLRPLGEMTIPILLVALGVLFSVNRGHMAMLMPALAIRYLGGLACATAIALLLGFQGDTFAIVVLMGAAPIGFMSVTLASMANLDVKFASSLASVSILLGLVTVPFFVWLLSALSHH
jgi:predicted permease